MEQEKFWARIADVAFSITYYEEEAREVYMDYEITETEEAIPISVTLEEIEENVKEHPEFTRGYNEGACIYRGIAEQLPWRDRLLMHGASISYEEDGYLFTAPSGTGKSTHISLWKEHLGDKVDIVNGDKPIVHIGNDAVYICGTPWGGKENWQKNRIVPLKGICLLKQAKENRIQQIVPGSQIGILMQQVFLPKEESAAAKTLELLDQLMEKVPFYMLECDMSREAVQCSFERMTGLRMEELK